MADTATTASKETKTTMSDDTETKKTKKTKKTKNGEGLAKLARLERGPARSVQETFRATPEEHNQLVADAARDGFGSMSDFYRSKLGLDDN